MRDFLALKLQCTTERRDKNFRGLWGMINLESCFASTCPNPLILVELAHVQCVSTMTCERAFSVQNLSETKVINMSGNKNLEATLQIALEGPDVGVDDILSLMLSSFGRMT